MTEHLRLYTWSEDIFVKSYTGGNWTYFGTNVVGRLPKWFCLRLLELTQIFIKFASRQHLLHSFRMAALLCATLIRTVFATLTNWSLCNFLKKLKNYEMDSFGTSRVDGKMLADQVFGSLQKRALLCNHFLRAWSFYPLGDCHRGFFWKWKESIVK